MHSITPINLCQVLAHAILVASPAKGASLEHSAAPAPLLGVVWVEDQVVVTIHPVAEP